MSEHWDGHSITGMLGCQRPLMVFCNLRKVCRNDIESYWELFVLFVRVGVNMRLIMLHTAGAVVFSRGNRYGRLRGTFVL